MGTFDTQRWLQSVATHLGRWPLAGTVGRVDGNYSEINLYPHGGGSHLEALVRWVRSMTEVSPVTITAVDKYTHLRVHGRISDGTPAEVVVLLHDGESDLLAAHVPLEKGATFPAALLEQLVGEKAAA